jgi:hypothetical protein
MKKYIQTVKTYILERKKRFILIICIIGALIIAGLITLAVYESTPKIVYKPADACKLFTPLKAEDLLGNKVIDLGTNSPVVSGNLATSQCSYTDTNPVENDLIVAAVAIRSGVNNEGIKQNNADFVSAKPTTGTQNVSNLGSSAYFNPSLGQLDILKGKDWYILSFGVGSTPQANTLDNDVKLANKILN